MKDSENKMFLSISIPTYNRENFLKNLLNNILPQATLFKNEVEICISNNGSSDNTREVVMDFMKKYPGLINYSESKKTIEADENFIRVMKMAIGKFIWLFGDDDSIARGGLGEVIGFIKKNCKENTGLVTLKEKSYFIDEKTGKEVVFNFLFEPNKPEILELSRKDVIKANFSSNTFMSVLIFNNVFLKKIFEKEDNLIKQAMGSAYIHMFLYRLMFLKFPELLGLTFNRNIVLQELPRYKIYIEGSFRLHYIARKKISKLLLSSGYADKAAVITLLREGKEARKNTVQDIIMMKTFKSFNYSSFSGIFKLFFRKSELNDAIIFSLVFFVMFLTPSFILKPLLKTYFFIKYNQDWKRHWIFCDAVHFKASQGQRPVQ